MKNNYEKSEKPGRIIIENSLFCEIDEECIYRKNQGMDRHKTDEYTINENAMKEDVINEDITDGHNSDKSNIDWLIIVLKLIYIIVARCRYRD